MIRAGAKHLSMTITRGKFEQLVDSLLNRTRQPCKDCLKDAGISQSEVTEVLLVGGMTRMPKVGRTPCIDESMLNPHMLPRHMQRCTIDMVTLCLMPAVRMMLMVAMSVHAICASSHRR